MKKSLLFKGLSATFCSLLAVCSFMSVLAYQREGDINLFLGIKAGSKDSTGSDYASKEAMQKDEEAYFLQTEAEGSVLLKNKNAALPLAKDSLKVTLFGNAAVNPVYHGASGGPANTGTNLKDALAENGFSVNETVYDKIKAQNAVRGNSNIAEVDASIYDSNDYAGYKDAAIVVLARYGGEANDMDTIDSYGVPELSFHDAEKAMMQKVKDGGFSKIIVLLNTGYAMDLGWLDTYNVDACLWIGFPGQSGMKAVAKMLNGEMVPSGHLVDTYAANSLSSPAMRNFGDFKFSDLAKNMYHCEYAVYAEDIYVGYKYYESRYYDEVRGLNNASSAKGTYAGESSWNYAAEVIYPFGYGLNYTTFSQTLKSLTWDKAKHTVTAEVSVKNTGKVASKDVVQLYVSLPYETGMTQKSAIQLVDYSKTKELAGGEEETLTIAASDYNFAAYDEKATNGADSSKKGCYVFDKGNYSFAIGSSAHDCLNNILAKQGFSKMVDEEGQAVSGDTSKVFVDSVSALDNTSYAKNPTTGAIVSNQFAQVDLNYYESGKVTYLSRDNWETYPETYSNIAAADDPTGEIAKHMTATSSLYVKPSDAPDYTTFKHSQEVTLKFADMKNLDYSDAKWETLVDELTPSELAQIYGEKMGNDALVSIGYPANSSGDGPDGLQGGGALHPSQNLSASTWNKELLEKRGSFLAEDSYYNGLGMVYGGGADFHRTPYGGRNFEYYSEDSILSYIDGRLQGAMMSKRGLIGAFKHFCGNDQETNRMGVATFMTEATLRTNQAKAFEGALTKGGALGNMSAFNRLGVIPTASYKALMTTLLREEWGFEGVSITDSSKGAASYIFTADAVDAGTDMFNNDGDRAAEVKKLLIDKTVGRDGNIWKMARQTAKHFLYSYANSKLINSVTSVSNVTTFRPWWKNVVVAIEVSLGSLAVLSLAGFIAFKCFIEPKKSQKE
jgi:beta-glucosidase